MSSQLAECTNPNAGGCAPFCAESIRLDMACDLATGFGATGLNGKATGSFVVIPSMVSLTRNPNVRRSTRSRYGGTNRKFVAGCAGQLSMSWNGVAMWTPNERILHYTLIHGGCAMFRLVYDPPTDENTDVDQALITWGRIVLNGNLVFDNNSTDEMRCEFQIDSLPNSEVEALSQNNGLEAMVPAPNGSITPIDCVTPPGP